MESPTSIMPSVLFVCAANMCRSPMAMALFRDQLERSGHSADWRVDSAGTWARDGRPAAEKAQQVMQEWGIDLSHHRSRWLDGELLRSFDLILVMTRGQREALHVEFPGFADRIYVLSEMVGKAYDVTDPADDTLADYRDVAHEIDALLTDGFERIVQLAGGAIPTSSGLSYERR